jgi:hypothetical protein
MRTLVAFTIVSLTACTSSSPATDVSGHAVYRDAATNADGSAHTAARPPAQAARVTLEIHGTGTMSGLDASCLDAASGQFRAVYHGDAQLADGGAMTAALDAAGAITTPSGCTIPSLTVGAVTGVTVRAELDATTTNCQSYCDASARADAEAQCGSAADQASCRASAEASASASCRTTCTSQSHAIVAETSLGIATLGQLDADQLRAGAFGAMSADFTFDRLQ